MDRIRRSQIAGFAAAFLMFLVFASCFLIYQLNAQETEIKKDLAAAISRHPELEEELLFSEEGRETVPDSAEVQKIIATLEDKYNFSYRVSKNTIRTLKTGAVLMTAAGSAFCVLALFLWGISRRREKELEGELRAMYTCLNRFSTGVFDAYKELPWEDEKLRPLCTRIEELGELLKLNDERRAMEEDNTKALITNISHQLKTPLASLRMSHELRGDASLSPEEREEFYESEGQEIRKLQELLDVMVNVSRLENHMIMIKPVPASLKNTIKDAFDTVCVKAAHKEISLALHMEEDFIVSQDVRWSTEALVNVLDNGIKYSPSGTSVIVRVQPLAASVLLEVEDEGVGVPSGEYHKIFQRFYRGTRAAAMESDGAGVGLYLARSILEQQGGTIRVKAARGGGSIFQLTFVLAEPLQNC